MEERFYSVRAFSQLTGVTERTLRYYDRIHLLKPSKYTEQGHRQYGQNEIYRIQRILTLKYLGYSLKEIKEILAMTKNESFQETLIRQKQMLQKNREEIDFVIQTIEKVEGLLGDKTLDSDILLALIHSVQHEQDHKRMFSKYFSETTLKQAFLEDIHEDERAELEQKFISMLKELKDLHSLGHYPGDREVQLIFTDMFEMFHHILSPQALEEIANFQDEKKQNLMISYFSPEFEAFIAEAFEIYEKEYQLGGEIK